MFWPIEIESYSKVVSHKAAKINLLDCMTYQCDEYPLLLLVGFRVRIATWNVSAYNPNLRDAVHLCGLWF